MRFATLLLALPAFLAAASPHAEMACGDSILALGGWTQADAEEVCLSVQAALRSLRTMGITSCDGLVVRPIKGPGAFHHVGSIGHYDARRNVIEVLRYPDAIRASFEDFSAFGMPMTHDLWRSFVAHETAHAVVERHFRAGMRHVAATEYLAAVVQLTTLPGATRDEILARYADIPAWGAPSEISSLYYSVNPSAFAVKSYRHFYGLTRAEQQDFVERLWREGLND